MQKQRNTPVALLALVIAVLGLVAVPALPAATVDRAVCSTADKAGGDPSVCSGTEMVDSATQEIAKLYQGNILVVQSVGGTANAITGSTSPAATALSDGEMRQIKPASNNTSTVTYNDNGLGAKQVVSAAGATLSSGDLQSSTVYILRYYQSNDEWRVLSPLGTGGSAPSTASYVTLGLNATLGAERVLTEGTNGIDISDGGANGNVTLNFDPTEVSNVTWGVGSLTNWTFNSTGSSDPSFSIFNQGMTLYNSDNAAATFFIGGQGRLGLVEANANGSDTLYLQAPSSLSASQTCTLENDANFIPDSCVGNGTDDGLISTQVDTSGEIAAIVGDETGTNKLVFSDSPTLVTPNLGTPSAVNLSNGTALPISGISGLGTGVGTWLGTPSSSNLAAAVTGETGSGALVFDTSPTLTTPNLGTPSAVNLSNGTALPISGISGLGTGVGTWLGTPSSSNLAAAVTGETGSGALVFGTSPTFTTGLTLGGDTISDFTGLGMALSGGALGLNATGATDEFCLTYEATGTTIEWQTCGGGGGGSPGGSNGQIQWNNAGAFDGFTMSGDVSVVTSTGAATIANDAVTYAKMQNVAANSVLARAASSSGDVSGVALSASQILGRGSSGDVAAITPANGLSISGTNLIPAREVLSANRTYYVRTDGSNSNNGLANTSGGAFLTLQKALDVAATIDFSGYAVTIQIADGTYTASTIIPRMVGQAGRSSLVIKGNNSTPANVVLTQATSFGATVTVPQGTAVTIKDLQVVATNGYSFYNLGGELAYQNIDFGTAGQYHVFAEGGFTTASGNYTISGNAISHFVAAASGAYIKVQSVTITASGSRAFTNFANAQQGGTLISNGCTFSGTFTGVRYSATMNGQIQTYGGGASYFPGNSAGSTATGGQYG